jgi:hypothetical protein
MAFEQKDLESIERVIYKNGDDIAISIGRSFERLEERIDATESRLYSRLADVEDKIETAGQDLADELGDLKGELREIARAGDQPGDVDTLHSV